MIFHTGGHVADGRHVPRRDVHEPVRDLRLRHRVDARRGDARTRGARRRRRCIGSVIGAFIIGGDLPLRHADGDPGHEATRSKDGVGPGADHRGELLATRSPRCTCSSSSAAIFVCCLSIMTSTIRLCFGMARDDQLPGSQAPGQGEPAAAHAGRGPASRSACSRPSRSCSSPAPAIIAIAATGMIYLSYFLGNLAFMRARLRGWPRTAAPFSLGRWGMPITVLGLCGAAGCWSTSPGRARPRTRRRTRPGRS